MSQSEYVLIIGSGEPKLTLLLDQPPHQEQLSNYVIEAKKSLARLINKSDSSWIEIHLRDSDHQTILSYPKVTIATMSVEEKGMRKIELGQIRVVRTAP